MTLLPSLDACPRRTLRNGQLLGRVFVGASRVRGRQFARQFRASAAFAELD